LRFFGSAYHSSRSNTSSVSCTTMKHSSTVAVRQHCDGSTSAVCQQYSSDYGARP
jgi:hypothetical protein